MRFNIKIYSKMQWRRTHTNSDISQNRLPMSIQFKNDYEEKMSFNFPLTNSVDRLWYFRESFSFISMAQIWSNNYYCSANTNCSVQFWYVCCIQYCGEKEMRREQKKKPFVTRLKSFYKQTIPTKWNPLFCNDLAGLTVLMIWDLFVRNYLAI